MIIKAKDSAFLDNDEEGGQPLFLEILTRFIGLIGVFKILIIIILVVLKLLSLK